MAAGRRLWRGLLAAVVAGAVVVPLTGAGPPPPAAPAPPRLPALAAHTLDLRYAVDLVAARDAARVAARHGDRARARALRALAAPDRRLLDFDGRGDGRVVEVLGDLRTAERVAVLVPGSDTTLDTLDRAPGTGNPAKALGGAARSLRVELLRAGPAGDVAVIAWLGYDAPSTVSADVLGTGLADRGARALRSFLAALHRAWPAARTALLCHSYGAVVCGRAARRADRYGVTDIAFYGAPGTGRDRAAGLGTRARVWAGRGGGDWIVRVPHTGADVWGTGWGLGPDPVDAAFGARRFAAGDGGHSDYLRPGSVAARNLARIAAGRSGEVGRG